ncbi:snRNA-activating protein complex subunit 3 [Orchesella cincta]|uniref:snRNA-activating protein complex subunit 3 n=1 Tax=Orchesella cincta TaxID=48709 RepID=A0A1D2MHQ8_ORCCI|nr:snRNA-activating protein complex subunit 3 [Orchesella cincta]
MENIFFPNARRWIAPSKDLGASTAELKRLVHLNKNSLLIIDPTEGEQNAEHESAMGSNGVDVDKPEYVVNPEEGLDVETQAEILKAKIDKQKENKWAESDDGCEDAVKLVGGSKFFSLREPKPPKKGGRRKAKNFDGEVDEVGNVIDEVEDMYVPGPSRSRNIVYNDTEKTGTNSTLVGLGVASLSGNIYEQFNYVGELNENDPTDDSILGSPHRFGVDENEELNKISRTIPEALEISDNENMEEFEYDNDYCNYANLSGKLEAYLELFDSDEVDSVVEASDVEENACEETNTMNDVDVETPENGLVQDNPSTSIVVKTSTQSRRKKKNKENKSKGVALYDSGKKKESDISRSQNLQLVHVKQQNPPPGTKEDLSSGENKEEESVSNFKRFIDWVFKQTHEKEKERLNVCRPGLMTTLNLRENAVKKLQKNTTAFLASSQGEVFQDDPILKSSSMPLLAPPVVNPSARSLQSLAVFLTHGEDPSCFPWKSVNVQQQINDDFVYDEFVKRMEQQKMDAANPEMKNELVDKEEDFLIQLLIYQATDPEDVLPDEVKLRRRADDEAETVVALGKGCRKLGRRRGMSLEDGDGNAVGGPNRYIEPKLAYELHVLGSQTVGDLMNAIHCENDYVYLQDVPHPNQYVEDPRHYAKKKYPSSMILIHETVYTDPRTSEMEYVSVINEWAKKRPVKRIGPFKRGNLNTKLKDLDLRFGFPYVYIHLSGCEHIFVFTKSRLLHLEDDHLRKNYPKIIGMTKFKNIYCRVDNEYLARWAVVGFKDCPENPMLLCSECVLMYCYDKRKQKRGDFKLYPFTQMANIL